MTTFGVLWVACTREQILQQKADSGDIEAMMELARANESLTGSGIVRKPNVGKAMELYRRAAEKGHSPAMYLLGQRSTTFIPNEERVMWLKKGAELGSEACIIELMNGYRFGQYGLSQDKGAAIYWELKRGELYLKRDRKSPEETRASLAQWEQRYRRENRYDGPIRPLP